MLGRCEQVPSDGKRGRHTQDKKLSGGKGVVVLVVSWLKCQYHPFKILQILTVITGLYFKVTELSAVWFDECSERANGYRELATSTGSCCIFDVVEETE